MAGAAAKKRRPNEWDTNWYTYGAAAPALPNREIERKKAPQKKVRRPAAKKKPRISYIPAHYQAFPIARTVATVVLIFGMLSLMVMRFSIISKKNLENLEVESRINELKTQIELLDVSNAQDQDLVSLQEQAEGRLNMGFALGDQIRYVTVEIPKEKEEVIEEASGFDLFDLLSRIRGIFE